ncbi:hypothetical protein Q8F57_003140 [Paraburkholderia terrae]|uniref:hypothetical protein n=1 Tax=Paraburkholderia terrae TaxID=311230 RepID=UPI00296B2F33|nr:hypothetical protein [Paraburkholderia terrae]MDW3655480.1 hypothetical protein [Paraburkholderia terrae]
MANYAIVQDGMVINVVVWDGNTEEWQPPEGTTAVLVTDETGPAYIGFPYADGHFTPPPPPVSG